MSCFSFLKVERKMVGLGSERFGEQSMVKLWYIWGSDIWYKNKYFLSCVPVCLTICHSLGQQAWQDRVSTLVNWFWLRVGLYWGGICLSVKCWDWLAMSARVQRSTFLPIDRPSQRWWDLLVESADLEKGSHIHSEGQDSSFYSV